VLDILELSHLFSNFSSHSNITATMLLFSPAFLVVFALATQSFSAPVDVPDSHNGALSLFDSYLTKTFDDGQYIDFTVTLVPPSGSGVVLPSVKTTGSDAASKSTGVANSGTVSISTMARASTSAIPAPSASTSTSTGGTVAKQNFTGDGSAAQGWPTIDKWLQFDDLWTRNAPTMGDTCQSNESPPKDIDTGDEKNDINTAIHSVSTATGVDARYILATIMQESGGCVRIHTTNGTVRNPGLMQDHNGTNSCADTPTPCPATTITGMIMDGTNGTIGSAGDGDGLKQTMAEAVTKGATAGSAQQVYWAARIYNSGSYVAGTPLEDTTSGISEYSDGIANRLLGWVG
jgi:hypothetical protein